MINSTYRHAEKMLTEKTINTIKNKVKTLSSEAIKKMKRNGMQIPKA
jgi:hypothetical protein